MENFDSFIGKIFGERYTVINIIGIGEYSVVFGAYDTEENRTVALKLLRPEFNDDQIVSERFTTEAEFMAMLSHPNIVKIFDTCLEGEFHYFVMEYIEGITLKKHILGKGSLDVDEIVFLSRQVLSALEAIHEKGIVHSDIKPQNVVVLPDGHVCLMDFGISTLEKAIPATHTEESDSTLESVFNDQPFSDDNQNSGFAVGTVHYVSPEQAEGRAVDHQSDIYSFGVMLYEMTTGILPFFGESAHEIALMHVRLEPLAPTLLNPEIPAGLEHIILRAMEKLPIARFASAREMEEALVQFSTEYHTKKEEEAPKELTPIQKAKQVCLDYFRNFNVPSFVMGSLCALLISMVISLGIVSGAVLSERKQPQHVKVPSLKGKELTAAVESLDADWYDFKITYVNHDERQGRIIKQSPAGGTVKKLANGEKCVIELIVACHTLPSTMPNLYMLPYDEIDDRFLAYDCEIEVVETPHPYIPKGTILSTYPEARQPSQHKITVYVSAGWQENTDTE